MNSKNFARKFVNGSLSCRQDSVQLQPQIMADLPNERLAVSHPPFSFTVSDYSGPILVELDNRTRSLSGQRRCISVYSLASHFALFI